MEQVIFHVDVNSAFLSWEAAYRIHALGETLDLREIPSAVGGSVEKRHGIILAKSILAKKCGVQTAMTISDALKKCPNLVLVSPHYDLYEKCSQAFIQLLHEYSPTVEQYSVDEAFVDMTGTEALVGGPVAAAHMIKDRIYRELGFTVNIGVARNKLTAKMAGELRKPNMVHSLLSAKEIEEKMWILPVGELFFVGRATEKKLLGLGIQTIGDLANTDLKILKAHLKKQGEVIYEFANGRDSSQLLPQAPANKGYGNSLTVPFDVIDHKTGYMVLLSLCETVCARLRKDHVKIVVVSVSIRDYLLCHESHQTTLFTATNITDEVYHTACQLFDELWDSRTPIRQLGVHTSRVVPEEDCRQLNLFTPLKKYETMERIDRTVDDIRNRFGDHSVMRAVFLKSKIEPMSGGITAEKHRPENEEVVY